MGCISAQACWNPQPSGPPNWRVVIRRGWGWGQGQPWERPPRWLHGLGPAPQGNHHSPGTGKLRELVAHRQGDLRTGRCGSERDLVLALGSVMCLSVRISGEGSPRAYLHGICPACWPQSKHRWTVPWTWSPSQDPGRTALWAVAGASSSRRGKANCDGGLLSAWLNSDSRNPQPGGTFRTSGPWFTWGR